VLAYVSRQVFKNGDLIGSFNLKIHHITHVINHRDANAAAADLPSGGTSLIGVDVARHQSIKMPETAAQ
jgi:hypothetical protein